jgi:CspA family cold shock protein
MQGTIRSFGQGFGFISRTGGPDVWFHAKDSPLTPLGDFQPGRRVAFSLHQDQGKIWAAHVLVEQLPAPGPQVGWVKAVDLKKGFGFIESESGDNVFFHRTDVVANAFGSLDVDTPLEFSIEFGERGRKAVNVRPF